MSALQQIKAAINSGEPRSLEALAWQLWRSGLPCRPIQLPESWWQQPTEIEAGLWISADSQEPAQWWLVQQQAGRTRLHPLLASSTPPPLDELQLQALSVWPALATSNPPLWRELQRYLQLGTSLRKALPAALLRAGIWLLLPALLALVLLQQLPVAVALLLAVFSLLLGLVLDNQWQRLWLNRSERQRGALGLNAMQRVLRLPLPWLRRFGGSGAMGLAGALQQLGQDLPLGLGNTLPAASLLACTSLVLLLWQPRLGLIGTAACLIWLAVVLMLLRMGRKPRLEQGQQRARATLRSQQLIETASNLRLAGAEQRALAWWQESEGAAQRLQPGLDWCDTALIWSALAASAVSLLAALQLQEPNSLLVALSLVGLQLGSAGTISQQLRQVEQLQPNWEGARLLLASPTEWRSAAADPGELRGDLAVEELSFRYGADQPLVLDQISFSAAAGSFVAVVGASGSGKSTLLRLLLGFEEPQQGRILFDGRDASALQHELLRPQIGTVLQNARLVGGTLLEVIAAGRAISVEQAWSAAEQAGLAEDLQALPMGLQTLVPAGGSNLSGGQRQRLAIARALAGQPRLLLFDEPTSALDNRSQQHVLNSLEQLAITRVLVAHRLSTVRKADPILVLDRGRLVQQGSYEQLVSQPGVFADLMRRQTL